MRRTDCETLRPGLHAFVDGELRGPVVIRLLGHLEDCAACSAELQALRRVGDLLRTASSTRVPPARLDGLAATVVSRSRAERDQSWAGLLRRATEDYHWLLVGAGSIGATFVCTALLSMLLVFGPGPSRGDSLAALLSNLSSPSGCMFVIGSVTTQEDVRVLSMDDHCAGVPAAVMAAFVMEAGGGVVREADLVKAVVATFNQSGRFVGLEHMTPEDRRRTELWLDQLLQVRLPPPTTSPVGPIDMDVQELRMYTRINAL